MRFLIWLAKLLLFCAVIIGLSVLAAYFNYYSISNLLILVLTVIVPVHGLYSLWRWATGDDRSSEDKRKRFKIWFTGSMDM